VVPDRTGASEFSKENASTSKLRFSAIMMDRDLLPPFLLEYSWVVPACLFRLAVLVMEIYQFSTAAIAGELRWFQKVPFISAGMKNDSLSGFRERGFSRN